MLINPSYRKVSIKTKLSILVASAVMLVIIALGIYFEGFLSTLFIDNARIRMLHGYDRLSYNLRNIEYELKKGIAFIESDEGMIASIELINNYRIICWR